jgi:cytochrome P450
MRLFMRDAQPQPPRVDPPAAPLGRAAFLARFVRNPLSVVPAAAYDEDFVPAANASRRFAWVTAPPLVKAVLLDQRETFQKKAQIRLLGPLLGRGILTSEGAHWKWQRQAAAPMFRPPELRAFVPTFVRAAEALAESWRPGAQGEVRDVEREMTRVTFDIIAATLLPSADPALAPAVEESVATFQKAGAWGQFYAMINVPQWLPRPGLFSGALAIRRLRGTVRGLVTENKKEDSLLRRLADARDPETGQAMNAEQLVDNLLTFYLAGHETTAKALTWTLYLLARSPQWRDALEEEIERVAGGAGLTAEHVEKLVLLPQVLKESMRLYPPIPLMSRQAVADATLGGHAIAAGTSVVLPIYAIHRHRKRWERPDEFDPERFSAAREAQQARYQYMPFGAGPRVCIGLGFAMLEATAILAALLRRVRFDLVEGHEVPAPVARVTLRPRGGMPLRVRMR